MWFFPTKKEVRKSFKKVHNEINILKLEISEIKGMLKVHENLRTSPPIKSKYHIKALQLANKAELINEIKKLLDKGLTTMDIYNSTVVEKGLCKKTCFYKYLKKVRKNILRTSQTITHELH